MIFCPIINRDLKEFLPERRFTEWLAREENIETITKPLGINIENCKCFVRLEGGYEADIVGHLKNNKNIKIIIENQYSRSDHSHLGQILAYSTIKEAKIVVWTAEEIREEHRAALRDLNRVYGEERFFFGIETKAIHIGNNSKEPSLIVDVVVKPEKWSNWRDVHKLTPTGTLYKDFWRDLSDAYVVENPKWQISSSQTAHWYLVQTVNGVLFQWKFPGSPTNKSFTVELLFEKSRYDEKYSRIFNALKTDKNHIEQITGSLKWEDKKLGETKRVIYAEYDKNFQIEDITADLRKDLIIWGVNTMQKFFQAFEISVRDIK